MAITASVAKKKLFVIADAGCDTGFAQVTHNLVEHLAERWDIHVLGINYYGDPHPIQAKCKLYNPAAKVQGDSYGINRIKELLAFIKPDVVFLINDPWVGAEYIKLLVDFDGPKILYTPIDATDLKRKYIDPLNAYDHVIAYTEFGKAQLQLKGLEKPISVIPHGVNTKLYHPIPMEEAKKRNTFPSDWYIVNVTDRNQIRKRIDLAFYYFKVWCESTDKPDNVKLHYHGAIQDEGWDIIDLAEEMGIQPRLIITSPKITAASGLPIELMPYAYAPASVGLSCTMGEGWGMTTHERMAMRIPMIVPEYSALGEWPKGGVHYTAISDIPFYNIKGLNSRGGIPELKSTIDALELMYRNEQYRNDVALKGYTIATDKKFQWRNIAMQFNSVFTGALRAKALEEKDDE